MLQAFLSVPMWVILGGCFKIKLAGVEAFFMAKWLQGQENPISAVPLTLKVPLDLEGPWKRRVRLSDDFCCPGFITF